jgi:hypothetical protein
VEELGSRPFAISTFTTNAGLHLALSDVSFFGKKLASSMLSSSPMWARKPAYFVVLVLSFPAVRAWAAQQPSDSERIRELEARVGQLEMALRTLIEGQRGERASSSGLAGALTGNPASEPSASSEAAIPISSPRQRAELPQELLPNLGKIGASVRFLYGTGTGGGGFGRDRFWGGSAQLPLVNLPFGKLNYELSVGTLRYDRPLGQSAQLLEIVPFGFVYSANRLDRYRIRPYAAVGLGNYVILRSAPTAGAGLYIGVRAGGGVEWRFSRDAGVGWDFRYNRTGGALNYINSGPSLFWHF